VSTKEVDELAFATMDSFLTEGLSPLDTYLLDEDDNAVRPSRQSALEIVQRPPKARKLTRKGSDVKWPEAHAHISDRKGIDWWQPLLPNKEIVDLYPCLRSLTDRNLDILAFNNIRFPDDVGTIEISQSGDRSRWGSRPECDHPATR